MSLCKIFFFLPEDLRGRFRLRFDSVWNRYHADVLRSLSLSCVLYYCFLMALWHTPQFYLLFMQKKGRIAEVH